MRHDDRPILRERGTRPGDGFADVLWGLVFGRWVAQMERDLYDLGIFKDYPWNQADGLHSGEGSYMVQQAVVAWADDVTLLGESSDATQLLSKVKVTAETMINRLLSYGMTPNLGAGKTEAILNPRGAKATQVRRHIFNEMKCCIPLETTMEQDATLRVVPKYKHLGSYIAHGGKNRPEVQHRIAQGHQTMRDYKTKLYANPRIPLHHRIAVMKATAFAAASYNIGSMSAMTQYDEKIWHHGIVGLYRKAMAKLILYQRLQHMTDEEVLVHAAALTPAEELRIARLRAYAQYLRRNHPFHWMILGREKQWLRMVQGDFEWFYRQIRGYTQHPPPDTHLDHWHDFIRNDYGRWQGLLRRVCQHAIQQRGLRQEVRRAHQYILTTLSESGVPIPQERTTTTMQHYRCLVCEQSFESYRAWAVHAFKKHQRVHPYRRLQDGKTCAACGHAFPTEARLARHFKNAKACAATVAAQRWWPEEVPAFGSRHSKKAESNAVLTMWEALDIECLPPRQGWPMTLQTLQLLKAACRCSWRTHTMENDEKIIAQILCTEAISPQEIAEVQDAMNNYHVDEEQKRIIRTIFEDILQRARPTVTTRRRYLELTEQISALKDVGSYTVNAPQRCPVRYRYVLHLYSGAKRDDDLHTYLLNAGEDLEVQLFPISIDIVLSEDKGNLLCPETQQLWLGLSRQGAIYFVYGGPPCETWSVSRWRYYDTGEGPQPLRSGDDVHEETWGWHTMRLRDLRQVACSNALLLFMLMIFATQIVSGGGALVEHPARPGRRQGRQPSTIWALPIVQFFLQCQQVVLIHISQGYWNAYSPKPTSFLITTPAVCGRALQAWLAAHKVREDLPEPIQMGHTKGTYSTAKLKRYPGPLC